MSPFLSFQTHPLLILHFLCFTPIHFFLFYIAPTFGFYTRSQLRATYHCLQVSISGPLLLNLLTPTLTFPPLPLPSCRVNTQLPQGWSHQSCIVPPHLYPRPLLLHPPKRPLFLRAPSLPSPPRASSQCCGHQSQHVKQPVLMEHSIRATLRVAEVEASRDHQSIFFSVSLSVPLSQSVWLITGPSEYHIFIKETKKSTWKHSYRHQAVAIFALFPRLICQRQITWHLVKTLTALQQWSVIQAILQYYNLKNLQTSDIGVSQTEPEGKLLGYLNCVSYTRRPLSHKRQQ